MHINILNASQELEQHRRTLPVSDSVSDLSTIERGVLLKIDSNGEWVLATDSDKGDADEVGSYIYFALTPGEDLVAGMAGSRTQPKVTAIGCTPTIRLETDMFESDTYAINDLLTISSDSKLEKTVNDGDTAYARVEEVATDRHVNDAWAEEGWRTGANVSVLQVTTMYVPQADNV